MGWVGGGDAGEVQKKNSRKGKLNEKKILPRQLILKNIHAITNGPSLRVIQVY